MCVCVCMHMYLCICIYWCLYANIGECDVCVHLDECVCIRIGVCVYEYV